MSTDSAARPAPAHRTASPPAADGRGWAIAGIAGGLVALGTLFGLSVGIAPSDEGLYRDNERLVAAMAGNEWMVWVVQAGTSLAALLVVVFGAGLYRRLRRGEPEGGLVPLLTLAGMLLVAVMLLVGGGISTELYHGLRKHAEFDPDTLAADLAIYNTMAWVWAGAGLSAGAVAVAGLRRRTVGRGVAIFSAVMAALVALTQLTPVQYMALLPGTLWVVVMGFVFALGRNR
ncbi:hypothetical protein [Thermomonospora amylolytica]|uniref:hypothetical protein n=1 Tax=Thermomonospora amylolytica TaxID=1411117 RepID=UPI000E6BE173|nr:hypothetical protein [Thermomonospora amylolytica]